MARKNWLVFIVILIIFAFALWVILPIEGERFGRQGMRLGLDLVGGSHLVYKAQFPEGATAEEKARNMDRALITIQNRIDKYGVTEPVIQKQEGERVLVQLPGFTDIEAAKELVEQTGFLEFRMVELDEEGSPVYLSDYLEDERSDFFNKGVTGARIFVDGEDNPIAFLDKDESGSLSFTLSSPVAFWNRRLPTFVKRRVGSRLRLALSGTRRGEKSSTRLPGAFMIPVPTGLHSGR